MAAWRWMRMWRRLRPATSAERKVQIGTALREYCAMNTEAMGRILAMFARRKPSVTYIAAIEPYPLSGYGIVFQGKGYAAQT